MKKREIRFIDYDEAYEILNEYLDSCKVRKKEKKKITKHTRRVVDICHQITNELESLGYHPDQELLDLSAIFHDIAKPANKKSTPPQKKDEELWQVEFEQHKQVAAGAPTGVPVGKGYSCSLGRLAKYSLTRP